MWEIKTSMIQNNTKCVLILDWILSPPSNHFVAVIKCWKSDFSSLSYKSRWLRMGVNLGKNCYSIHRGALGFTSHYIYLWMRVVLGELKEIIRVKPLASNRGFTNNGFHLPEGCLNFPTAFSKAFFCLNFGQILISAQYFFSCEKPKIIFLPLVFSVASQPQALPRCQQLQSHFH